LAYFSAKAHPDMSHLAIHNSSEVTRQNFADSEVADLTKLLHLADAAKFLAVSKRTLQQLTADRLVAVVKFGRNVRYDVNDLRRFAESRKIFEIGWKASSKKATTASTGGSL
jgi:excisionase family DNA binding protein